MMNCYTHIIHSKHPMSNQEQLINIPTKIKYSKKTSSTFVLFEIFAVLSIQ